MFNALGMWASRYRSGASVSTTLTGSFQSTLAFRSSVETVGMDIIWLRGKRMKELSEKLLCVVEAAEPRLREISELESIKPILSGGWSRKQVIGHLIDSASNNHQRFVRAALQTSLVAHLPASKLETHSGS